MCLNGTLHVAHAGNLISASNLVLVVLKNPYLVDASDCRGSYRYAVDGKKMQEAVYQATRAALCEDCESLCGSLTLPLVWSHIASIFSRHQIPQMRVVIYACMLRYDCNGRNEKVHSSSHLVFQKFRIFFGISRNKPEYIGVCFRAPYLWKPLIYHQPAPASYAPRCSKFHVSTPPTNPFHRIINTPNP